MPVGHNNMKFKQEVEEVAPQAVEYVPALHKAHVVASQPMSDGPFHCSFMMQVMEVTTDSDFLLVTWTGL